MSACVVVMTALSTDSSVASKSSELRMSAATLSKTPECPTSAAAAGPMAGI